MRIKLIASLLVLCLTFSIGSALAQTDNTNTSMNKSASPTLYPLGVILLNGNVTGTVTLGGEKYSYTGPVLIVKNLNKKTERILLSARVGTLGPMVANGELAPLQVKRAESQKQNMSAESSEAFAFMFAKDFKCNMTNMTSALGGNVDLDLSGDSMGLFGTAKDVSNLLNTTTESSQCSMTEVVTYPV